MIQDTYEASFLSQKKKRYYFSLIYSQDILKQVVLRHGIIGARYRTKEQNNMIR